FGGYGNACNCISTLNNGVPTQVQVYLGTNLLKNDLTTGYADDTWQVNKRMSVSLGIRLDHYKPSLPDQTGPSGEVLPANDAFPKWNNWGPRIGFSYDLSGTGKTVVKAHYGLF